MKTIPISLVDEPIQVEFATPPVREKAPSCPQQFTWRGKEYSITSILEEWIEYERRGRMAKNMAPAHLASASHSGSWGVERFYFRVTVDTDQVFEIYYDRAPKDVNNRKGGWFLKGERSLQKES
ncbi:MAG: DUF6504 family protein [Anaerolineaceae bacterium]